MPPAGGMPQAVSMGPHLGDLRALSVGDTRGEVFDLRLVFVQPPDRGAHPTNPVPPGRVTVAAAPQNTQVLRHRKLTVPLT